MRSILVTVMMLIVVSLLFTSIITNDTTEIKAKIEQKGTVANNSIRDLDTN